MEKWEQRGTGCTCPVLPRLCCPSSRSAACEVAYTELWDLTENQNVPSSPKHRVGELCAVKARRCWFFLPSGGFNSNKIGSKGSKEVVLSSSSVNKRECWQTSIVCWRWRMQELWGDGNHDRKSGPKMEDTPQDVWILAWHCSHCSGGLLWVMDSKDC